MALRALILLVTSRHVTKTVSTSISGTGVRTISAVKTEPSDFVCSHSNLFDPSAIHFAIIIFAFSMDN